MMPKNATKTGTGEVQSEPRGPEPPDTICGTCEAEMWWNDCPICGGAGVDEHDCGEDTCACAFPQPNVLCDNCDGEGGAMVCPRCARVEDL